MKPLAWPMVGSAQPNVVFAAPLPSAVIAVAKEFVPEGFGFAVADLSKPEFLHRMRAAEFLVTGFVRGELNDAFYAAAPHLKLVQLIGSGYDGVDVNAARRARVPVATNGGANAGAVAEHTMLLMLAVLRRLPWHHGNLAAGRWTARDAMERPLYELAGRQLGLIGFGAIGREVARRARAFDMTVAYYRRQRLAAQEEQALGVSFMNLPSLLASSDVVSLHLPLNDATRHLIGAKELAQMKPGAILINTARGAVVDQDALYAALSSHAIAGAGLDVFAQEPPAPDDRLLALANVVLTPHVGGPTAETWRRSFRNAFANVQRVAGGMPPLWVIPELT